MTRLGDFLKFLVANLLTKVDQIFADSLGYFEDITFNLQLLWLCFGQLLENIGLLFIATFGHAD